MRIKTNAPATGAPSLMGQYAKPDHLRAARVLLYAITLDHYDVWRDAGPIFASCLDDRELASASFTFLRAMDPENAQDTVETWLHVSRGCI